MMKKILLAAVIVLSSVSGLQAKDVYKGEIKVRSTRIERVDRNLHIDAIMDLENMRMRPQGMLVVTPVLKANDGTESQDFSPVVITGGARKRMLSRQMKFGDFIFPVKPSSIIRKNNRTNKVDINLVTPHRGWMNNSTLYLMEHGSGCARCRFTAPITPIGLTVSLPVPVQPVFELIYVRPPVEDVKQRSETYSAYLNYVVNRYDLRRDFMNNAAVLDEVDRIVNELRNDPNLTINKFNVVGYASPEGSISRNQFLSENRALAFINYMRDRHGWDTQTIQWEGRGEDWAGLRRAVEASNVQDREQILRIIDNVPDDNERERQIKALSGGRTYRMLLDVYYPPLRRNEYTISYVAKPFSIEEAKEIIKTKPQYLSLNEMFNVANAYPKGSKEFKEVFDIAVKLYPYDKIAMLNSATLYVESGAYDVGIKQLGELNMPEAWNNIGVAYANKDDLDNARKYFQMAADSGNATAMSNLRALLEWLEEK